MARSLVFILINYVINYVINKVIHHKIVWLDEGRECPCRTQSDECQRRCHRRLRHICNKARYKNGIKKVRIASCINDLELWY